MDCKLVLFAIFSVGLVTLDLGSDSIQADDYIQNENFYWGYSTIITMFVPLMSVCIYVILSRREELCQCKEGVWWDSVKTIGRHFPFVQPFVHLYYLKDLMTAKAEIERSLKFYNDIR